MHDRLGPNRVKAKTPLFDMQAAQERTDTTLSYLEPTALADSTLLCLSSRLVIFAISDRLAIIPPGAPVHSSINSVASEITLYDYSLGEGS